MAYVSLYRKWRPQTFADVVGQDHIVSTLVNALRSGQVHHAMLFCGTRGTGKTTTARILAKALNCERGPTPEPCNACEQCRGITEGTSLDVVEIDAASHGSVDDARDLREKASYAPASARSKVYIVDEAHMVTQQGFNAMLKVLEEPPPHVHFVFATTEPHKVIEAIRSRCQRYDFRRIRTEVLVEYLGKICAAEGVEAEPAALELVARAGDGSARDALSRLDQVLTYAGKRVALADVAHVLGTLPVELRFDLADALAAGSAGDALGVVERVVQAGHDLGQFAREAVEHLRDLFVMRVAPDAPGLVDATPETRERLAAQAERFGPGELARMVRLLSGVLTELRAATDQRLVLELGLARCALPETSLDAEALLARIERLERRLAAGGAPPAPAAPAGSPPPPPPPGAPPEPPSRTLPAGSGDRPAGERQGPRRAARAAESDWSAPAAAAPAGPLDLDLVRRSWPQIMQRVQAASRLTASLLEQGHPAALQGRQLTIEFPPEARFHAERLSDRSRHLETALEQVLGSAVSVRLVVSEDAPAPAAAGTPAAAEGPAAAADPPPPVVEEPEIDPDDQDQGEELGANADVRAVADLAVRELGGEVIEERPNTESGR